MKEGNKHSNVKNFILTSVFTWYMGSRWYISDLHI